jgi:trehalose 6-phosphate phosphatase
LRNLQRLGLSDRKQFEPVKATARHGDGMRGSVPRAADLYPPNVVPAQDGNGRPGTSGAGQKLNHSKPMPRPASHRKSQHLFDHWKQVQRRLAAAKHLALFLDFDGTLAPLRPRPADARLDESTRALLRRLARSPSITLCIISGRRRADLQKRVNVRRAIYLGLHGWERDTGARSAIAARGFLASARRLLTQRLSDLPHIWVGDKGPCFEVHYNGASGATIREARTIIRDVLRPLKKETRVLRGRKVWEVLPREIEGKGAAVRALLAEFPRPVLAIYIGDDTSDESAFQALHDGITVRVGRRRRTRAHFELRNPEEVSSFLQRLEAEVA